MVNGLNTEGWGGTDLTAVVQTPVVDTGLQIFISPPMLSFVQGSHNGWLGVGGRSCPCLLYRLEADPGLGALYQRQVQGRLESTLLLRMVSEHKVRK